MQVRDDEIGKVRLLGADGARTAGEDEEARHLAGRVVRAVREHVARTQARELARRILATTGPIHPRLPREAVDQLL